MQQTILVDTNTKKLYLLENDKIIKEFKNIKIGLNGVTNNKVEGDGKTPLGTFSIGHSFGIKPFLTNYEYHIINENIYWIDDPNSKYYNQWIDISITQKDWQSAEHLIDYPIEYELGVIINYNIECKKGKGSAIFLHIENDDTTHGCTATTKSNIEFIIKWLNKESNPTIKII